MNTLLKSFHKHDRISLPDGLLLAIVTALFACSLLLALAIGDTAYEVVVYGSMIMTIVAIITMMSFVIGEKK